MHLGSKLNRGERSSVSETQKNMLVHKHVPKRTCRHSCVFLYCFVSSIFYSNPGYTHRTKTLIVSLTMTSRLSYSVELTMISFLTVPIVAYLSKRVGQRHGKTFGTCLGTSSSWFSFLPAVAKSFDYGTRFDESLNQSSQPSTRFYKPPTAGSCHWLRRSMGSFC